MTLRSKTFVSSTLIGFCVVLILDLWIALAHPLSCVTTPSLERSEIFNAVKAYAKETSAPDIVLLGSSLVTAPVMQAESSYLKRAIPRMTHRRCEMLSHCLSQRLATSTKVFCLAVGGEMASDAYLITKNILKSPFTPHAIVYGIAPRDFQDNLLPSIDASETFQVVAQPEDLNDFLSDSVTTFEKKASMILSRTWMLWRYKSDIRINMILRTKKLIEKVLPFVLFEKYGKNLELKPQRKGQFPEEAIGTPKAYPGLPLDHLSESATLSEYIKRYNPPDFILFNKEFDYFKRLLNLCRKRRIVTVVVNMPLSRKNQALLTQGLYNQYLERIKVICQTQNVEFLDMNTSPWDKSVNFVDSVHLAPKSSNEFLRVVSEQLAKSQIALTRKRARKGAARLLAQPAIQTYD